MNILEEIIAHKKKEVAEKKQRTPVEKLERSAYFTRRPFPLSGFLVQPGRTGIIAEFKRKSPSKGIFNSHAQPAVITKAYADNGASGLSVLTDRQYFAGSEEDLQEARSVNQIPILRKDFIIDEYQVLEAKAIGADVILLIAECLSEQEVRHLSAFARRLELEVLLEVHNREELEKITPNIGMVGVNNRDLTIFKTDIQRSFELADQIPAGLKKVAESGISRPETVKALQRAGFHGFLIGESFMKEEDPGAAFKEFVTKLRSCA